MARHRFYAPPSCIEQGDIRLDASESHHLRHVLRLPVGITVFVFDGSGIEYACRLEGFEQERARLRILQQTAPAVESPLELTLAQGLTSREKFELIIQKATELGVHRIVPLITAYALSRGIRSVSEQRLRRWRRIALEATKQCGRTRLTEISRPLRWQEFLADLPLPALLFSQPGARLLSGMLSAQQSPRPPRCLLVGPEGGWQQAEIDAACAAGAVDVSLGPRVLRAETAAIVAVSLVQFGWGDLR